MLFSDNKCEWTFLKLAINLYESFDILTKYIRVL